MLGLGIGITSNYASSEAAAAIEDYFWEVPTAGELAPLVAGTVSDFHDTWDLDGTDYMPQTTTTVGAEGYWELDGTDIQPITV